MHSTHETLQPVPPTADADLLLHPSEDPAPGLPASLEEIAAELEHANRSVAALVARIDDLGADPDLLDDLTERIVTVLARIEQLRCARAWWHATAQRDQARWADYLDVA